MGRFIKISLVLVVLYAVIGFFVLPPLAKKELEKRLEAELGRNVSIGELRVNPFAMSTTIDQFEVSTPDSSGRWMGWRRLYVNVDPLKSFTGDWAVGQIALSGFNAAVEISPEGQLNFADLIEKYTKPDETPKERSVWARPVRIGRLDIAAAQVDFTDWSKGTGEPFKSTAGPVNFTLLQFRTEGSGGAAYRFEATSEAGEKLEWTGTLSANPLSSAGDWRIEKLQLAKYAPYLAEQVQAHVAAGELTVSGRYEVSFAPGDQRIVLTEGALQLQHLQVLEQKGGPAVLELAAAEIAGVSADGMTRRVSVDTVRLGNGRAVVRRNELGSLNLQNLLKTNPAEATPTSAPTQPGASPPLTASVKTISLRDFAVEFSDEAVETPVQLKLARIEAEVNAFTTEPGAPMPVTLSLGLEPQGTARISGNVTLDPMNAVLDLELTGIPLTAAGAYLQDVVNARVKRGTLTVKGQANVTMAVDAAPTGTFTGSARVEDLAVTDAGGEREFAGISEFALTDIKMAATPRVTVSVGEVKLDRPFARVVRDENGELSLSAMLKTPAAEEPAVNMPPADTTKPEIAITRVTVQDGDFAFADLSVQPAVNLSLTQVNGALRNMSSLRPELGDADVQARVNGSAPVRILGRINPLVASPFADVRVDLDSMDLVPASPYFGKYVGYKLDSGRLFVETRANLANDALRMNNSITVEQFNLGAETKSPEALKLPVKLGVALLKDAQGRIALDVPVEGSLADPKFQIGQVVGKVFSNLLTKAATSPFALLGSMFGGGGEELGLQEFEPGTLEFAADSRRRLDVVRRALMERPALAVEIEGGADPAVDAEGVKRRKLDRLLRQEADEGAGGERTEVAILREDRPLSAEERESGLRALFQQRFPSGAVWESSLLMPGASGSSPVRPAAEAAVPMRAPSVEAKPEKVDERRGLIRRTWDLATLKGARDWWGSRHERRDAAERGREEARRAEQERARIAAEAAAQPAPVASAANATPAATVEEMERHLLASIAVEPGDLADLARARAQRVREVLLAEESIAEERVQIAEPKTGDQAVRGPRARLHLR